MEFALVLPLAFLVLVAATEVVITARTQLEIVAAAREGAREAAASPDPQRAVDATQAALGPQLAAVARVSVTRPAVVGRAATVRVELPHRFAAPLLGGLEVRLTARAVMRVEK